VIDTQAYVLWDETPEMVVKAEALRVRSAPALRSWIRCCRSPCSTRRPDGSAGVLAASVACGEEYLELPQQRRCDGTVRAKRPRRSRSSRGCPGIEDAVELPAHLSLALPAGRVDWTVRYLEEHASRA